MAQGDEWLELIRRAGVVGCGGAGFPTHRKLDASADIFLVNGAECEPQLRTDRTLMRRFPGELVRTAAQLGQRLGAREVRIALKETYKNEIAALEAAVAEQGSTVRLLLLENFYPAGDEQMVVQAVGRSVPPGGLPLEVGAVVSNVATVLAVAEAWRQLPCAHRTLTVTGAVREPVVLRVPLGTSYADCIAQAGGAAVGAYRVISGGPLMGRMLTAEEAAREAVAKTTSGLIVVPEDSPYVGLRETSSVRHTVNRARAACIQCSFCTAMCPRHAGGHPLRPHRIMRKLAYAGAPADILEDPDVHQALICCECGICEDFACPMGLKPRQVNSLLKAEYAKAGIRYQRAQNAGFPEVEPHRTPSRRLAARLGLLPYYDLQIDSLRAYTPDRVEIPLRQHIGAPAVPEISPGDRVRAGQRVAACPEGVLGAHIHTGIAGVVTAVGERIIIEQREGGAP